MILEDRVESWMATLEGVLLAVLGRVATWITPLPSAVLVGRATARIFELSGVWPWIMAGVVELVGLVTGALWTTAREWNQNKNKSDPEANETLARVLLGGYFVTTVALLLAVELPSVLEMGDLTGLTALLFPGLSGVSILALNERVAHRKRIVGKQAGRSGNRSTNRSGGGSRTGQRNGRGVNGVNGDGAGQPVQVGQMDRANRARQVSKEEALTALLAFYAENPAGSYREAGKAAGRSKSWAVGAVQDLEAAGRVQRNGHGVEVVG